MVPGTFELNYIYTEDNLYILPTPSYRDEDINKFNYVQTIMNKGPAYHSVIMGDFNILG